MNKSHVKGTAREFKGKVKETVGHATNDTNTEADGVVDQLKGKLERGFGDVKDVVKKGVDTVMKKIN